MRIQARIFALVLMLTAAGCGVRIPPIAEIGDSGRDILLTRAVTASVRCEIQDAVNYVIDEDIDVAKLSKDTRKAIWFDDWGVLVGLTILINEKSSFSPSVIYMPPSSSASVFTLNGGGSISSEATRTDTVNFYYSVRELRDSKPCDRSGVTETGSPLIRSDLKTKDWLLAHVLSVGTGEIRTLGTRGGPYQNALTHQIKFDVVTSGSVNPSWKLVRATINSGTLFSTSRMRSHSLLMTFGPVDPANKTLVGPAASSHAAAQVGLAVADNLRQE